MNKTLWVIQLPVVVLGISAVSIVPVYGNELTVVGTREVLAQVPPASLPPVQDIVPLTPSPEPLPVLPPPVPAPDELLRRPATSPPEDPTEPSLLDEGTDTFIITEFRVVGSTVFSDDELRDVTAPYTNRPITFAEVLQARSAVTQLYLDNDYITSGAIFPPQRLENGVATIQVIEGTVEAIAVNGTTRLDPEYVESRLALVTRSPLQVTQLVRGLELLQLDPLIETISADLQAGTRPGTNRLVVTVTESDTFAVNLAVNNDRSPNVGSLNRQISLSDINVSGVGDAFSVTYANSDGVNELSASYELPINPRNGTIGLDATLTSSEVIADEFEALEISANSHQLSLTFEQPIIQAPDRELSLGVSLSRQFGQTRLGIDDIGPFPLSPGADERGQTTVTALEFFQSWVYRDSLQVFSARSQVNLGLDFLGSTVNTDDPDSRFLSWQGQIQWVRLLAPDTLLLVRGSTQLSTEPLLSQEQFGVGGRSTVRGYRQDLLLTDNGLQGSIEARLPILRIPQVNGLLQLTPFVDAGYSWNAGGERPDPNHIIGVGAGLLWQQPNLTVRLDWGIPLVSVEGEKNTWQENGIYLTVNYLLF